MKTNLLLVLLLDVIATGCLDKAGKPDNFDYGRVENSKYVNSFFDLEMTLPPDWSVQTQEQLEHLTNAGKELVAGDDERMQAVLKASEINTANLLAVYQYELGSPVDYNPSIMLIAENIQRASGVRTGGDYLFHSRKLLEQSQMKYDHLDKEFEKEVINGLDFYKMNAEMSYMGVTFKQVYYSTVLKGFSFNAIISFANDEQKSDLLKFIHSIKFQH
jgi:hypothetical protein